MCYGNNNKSNCHNQARSAFLQLLTNRVHTKTSDKDPTIMKLGTVIPYLKKIYKIYKSRDASLQISQHQNFFTGNQRFLFYQDCILKKSFCYFFLFESLIVVLINLFAMLMMSAKLDNLCILKVEVL